MKNIAIFCTLILLCFNITVSPSLAQTKTKTNSIVKLPTFAVGETNTVDKPIVGDLMIAGGENSITTSVTGDTYVAGGKINVSGDVTGNLIIAGGEITLSGTIGKNLIVVGGQVTLDNQSVVTGYVLAAGGEVNINGHIQGPVKVGAGSLSVGEKAIIGGHLEASVSETDISDDSKISGEKKINIIKSRAPNMTQEVKWGLDIIGKIYFFVSRLIILLVLVKLFGKKIKSVGDPIQNFWSISYRGTIILIITPIAALLFMITIVGIPFSILTIVLYIIALYLASLVAATIVGVLTFPEKNTYLQATLGYIIMTVIGLIPVVGSLAGLISLIFGLGIVARLINEKT